MLEIKVHVMICFAPCFLSKKISRYKKYFLFLLSIYIILAEVPGDARVNIQPAEQLCPSGFRVSGPPRPRGVGGV